MTYNKKTITVIMLTILVIFVIMRVYDTYNSYSSFKWKGLIVEFIFYGILIFIIRFITKVLKKYNVYNQMKDKTTKNHLVAATLAIILVTIAAMPSENNSYTECGVGSVYTKHYYHYYNSHERELTSEGCDLTTTGFFKLLAIFSITFYISLFFIERREKLKEDANPKTNHIDELEKEIKGLKEGKLKAVNTEEDIKINTIKKMKEVSEKMIDDIILTDGQLRFFEDYYSFIQLFKDFNSFTEYDDYSTVSITRHKVLYKIFILKEDTSFLAYSENSNDEKDLQDIDEEVIPF